MSWHDGPKSLPRLTARYFHSLPSSPSRHDLVHLDVDPDSDPDSGTDDHHGEAPGAHP
jgi:hypothetical protein